MPDNNINNKNLKQMFPKKSAKVTKQNMKIFSTNNFQQHVKSLPLILYANYNGCYQKDEKLHGDQEVGQGKCEHHWKV